MTDHGASRARSRWRDLLVALAALEAGAVAVWLIPASVAIVSWPATGPVRLALLAPTTQLVWFALAALAVCVVVAQAGWSSTIAPLALLWIWAIPFLPWLPDRVPFLLLFAGPLRWAIAAIAVGAMLAAIWRQRSVPWSVAWRPGRRSIFAISAAFYVVCGLYSARTIGLGGDEPHYLVLVESLLRDGDLIIENNHARGDYRAFYPAELRPDFMQRGSNGAIYSIHAPGLPVLLLPAYAAAGARGAVAVIAIIAALAALAIYDLAALLGGPAVGRLTWAAVCLTVPFVPQSWLIFPEMPGALLVAWALLWLAQSANASVMRWLLRGAAMAVLPWLHTKFVVFQAILSCALVLEAAGIHLRQPGSAAATPEGADRRVVIGRADIARVAAFAIPGLVSVALWLYSFYAIYGVFSPEAPYGTYAETYVLTKNIPHGLLGLFVDQKFGLLFYTPIYAFAVVGAWLMLRDRRQRALLAVAALTAGAFVGTTARLYMFWGGSSAPARFLVPVLPCLVPMLAAAFVRLRDAASRGLIVLAVTVSVVFTVTAAMWPQSRLFFSDPHGRARVLQMLEAGAPLADSIPTFTDPDWLDHLPRLAPWLLVGAAAIGAAFAVGRRPRATPAQSIVAVCLVGAAGTSLITARPPADVRARTARRGALNVLWTFDGARHRTFDYANGSRASAERLSELETVSLESTAGDSSVPTSSATLPPRTDDLQTSSVALPPGTYDVRVWFAGSPRPGDRVEIFDGQTALGEADLTGVNPAIVRLEFPVTIRRFVARVRREPGEAGRINDVQLMPVAVVPPGARPSLNVHALEGIRGHLNGYVIYTDDVAYPEGGIFWTRGTAETRIVVAPGSARRLELTLSTGPVSGVVRVTTPSGVQEVSTPARQEQELVIDVRPGMKLVPITIGSSVMFQPSEFDPASTDRRQLGARVLISAE